MNDAAERLYLAAIAAAENHYGTGAVEVATLLNDLAVVYTYAARFDDTEALFGMLSPIAHEQWAWPARPHNPYSLSGGTLSATSEETTAMRNCAVVVLAAELMMKGALIAHLSAAGELGCDLLGRRPHVHHDGCRLPLHCSAQRLGQRLPRRFAQQIVTKPHLIAVFDE